MRANDFRDLLLLVRQRADLPAATTTKPRPFCLLGPTLDFKSNPSDKPEKEEDWKEIEEGEEVNEQ